MYKQASNTYDPPQYPPEHSPPSTPPMLVRKQLFTTPSTPSYTSKANTGKSLAAREPINVFLRIRPFTTDEVRRQESRCVEQPTDSVVLVRHAKGDELRFSFTSVFGPTIGQQQFFRDTTLPLVEAFLQGHNGLLFAYGITNAGKTHTITGNPRDPKDRGILPRVLDVVFNSIEGDHNDDLKGKESATFKMDESSSFAVFISYTELYNDSLRDLLVPGIESTSTDDRGKRSITEVHVTSRSKAEDLLRQGMQARQSASTQLNSDSSRSHCMLTIKLVIYPKDTGLSEIQVNPSLMKFCKLCVVDLAGSERGSRTGAVGQRIKEAGNINNSLLTLSRCLEALRWNQTHPNLKPQVVPFRDNKLTVFFKEYFTGSAKAVMIVNVNPCTRDCEETINVLKFAAVAKEITTTTRLDTHRHAHKDSITPARTLKKKRKVEEMKLNEAEPTSGEEILQLKLELEQLREQLEEKIIWGEDLENQIREEAAEEMTAALCSMETQYRARLTAELESMERRYQNRLDIANRITSALSEISNPVTTTPSKQDECHEHILIEELQSQLRMAETKVQFLEEKVSNMSADRDQDAVYVRARMEQELQETRLQFEANCRMEVYTLEYQLEQERKDKKCLEEEIVDLKARIEELVHLTTFNMGKDTKVKTPSHLVKIAKYGIVEQTPPSVMEPSTTLWKGDVAPSVSGDGVSVRFTEVNVITPTPTPQVPTPTRPADPMQAGLVMQEAHSNGEWHNIAISPESKPLEDSKKCREKAIVQSPLASDTSLKAHKGSVLLQQLQQLCSCNILSVSKKLAQTLSSPKNITPAPPCTLLPTGLLTPTFPSKAPITSPKNVLSPKSTPTSLNKENDPPELKSSRKLFVDKEKDHPNTTTTEPKLKRKRAAPTPIAKRLRSRAK